MAKNPAASGYSSETLFSLGGFVLGAVVTGIAAAFIAGSSGAQALQPLRESSFAAVPQYTYIDPLIGVSSSQTDSPGYADLEGSVGNFLAVEKKSGLLSASVSLRDIHAAQGFTVNPAGLYSPASLFKVPLMMAYYRLAEDNPSILSQRLVYTGVQNLDANENIKSPVQLVPGMSYSVEELIEHMVKYSDNNAVAMLDDHLGATGKQDALTQLFNSLGLPSLGGNTDFLTVQSYALFFRVLYNSTYLNTTYSEDSLSLLANTDFSDGIEAGVPNPVSVAHKFGDSNLLAKDGSPLGNELHDCGIVYYPAHPYLLCVMTEGKDIPTLESVIAGVSRLVYQDMEHRYPAGDTASPN